MWSNTNVKNGMFVSGTKGERIGKVIRCDAETFVVERGVFFPKDYELRYDHIVKVQDGAITYSLSDFLEREARLRAVGGTAQKTAPISAAVVGESVTVAGKGGTVRESVAVAFEPERSSAAAASATMATAATAERERLRERTSALGEGVRIPLMKEEIEVEKVSRETGHVRVHKAVKTEEKHFTVPITREDIVIEHLAADKAASAMPRDAAFEEETIDVILHEEELRVTKHPVLREEVVLRTTSSSVEKEGSATLRYEEAEIEDTRRAPGATIETFAKSETLK